MSWENDFFDKWLYNSTADSLSKLVSQLNGIACTELYGKIIRFEYMIGVDLYPPVLSLDNKELYICMSQENENIHVFADSVRNYDYIEYICKGSLDQIVRPHVLARDEWMDEKYDVVGTDIREWKTVDFSKEWLKQQYSYDLDLFEEMDNACDFGGLFKIIITFDCGKVFTASGFSTKNEDLDNLVCGVFGDHNMLRLLATWGFAQDMNDVVLASDEEWWKAKQEPFQLVAYWVDGQKHLPTSKGEVKGTDVGSIEFADFVVRTNAFYCHKNHSVESINAIVNLLQKDGRIIEEAITAGYCKNCNCYFILEQDFLMLQAKGILLCQLLSDKEFFDRGIEIIRGEELKAQSVLRRCGYTVNATVNLSVEQRQKILSLVIDSNLYSTVDLCSFLDWLISFHGKNQKRNMENAIERWKADRDYVSKYKSEYKRNIGIKSIKN